jgi:hypothetical protein
VLCTCELGADQQYQWHRVRRAIKFESRTEAHARACQWRRARIMSFEVGKARKGVINRSVASDTVKT